MDEPDPYGAQQLIPAEGRHQTGRATKVRVGPVAVEVGMPVGMRVGLAVMRVGVSVLVPVDGRGRREALGEGAQPSGQVEDPESDQHERDDKLHRQADRRRNDNIEADDEDADDDDGDRVSQAPQGADERRVNEPPAAVQDRGHGDDVIRIGGVAHAQQESESGQGDELGHPSSIGLLQPCAIAAVSIDYAA